MELFIVGALFAAGAYGLYRLRSESAAPGSSPHPHLPARPVRSVVAVGDSLAVGMSKRIHELASIDEVQLDYRAKVSTRVSYWAERLPDLGGVDVLLVVLGTNDAAGSAKSFEAGMSSILQHASMTRTRVVWAMPTGDGVLPSYDEVVSSLEHAAAIGGISSLVDAPAVGYAKDGVHLQPDAYRRWADRIWNAIKGDENA